MNDTTTPKPATYAVALVNITDGTVQGHKAGCADLKRGTLRKHADDAWELEVTSKREAYLAYNADFIAESGEEEGHWPITWAACAKHVPDTAEAPAGAVPVSPWRAAQVVGVEEQEVKANSTPEARKAAKVAAITERAEAANETESSTAKKAPAKPRGALGSVPESYRNVGVKKAAAAKAEAPAPAKAEPVKEAAPAPAKKAAPAPAPEVDGVWYGTSGAQHGLSEGTVFLYHGDDKKAPTKKGVKLTMHIADRIWITGLDAKGVEQMRVHIGRKFWAAPAPQPAKKATPAKKTAAK